MKKQVLFVCTHNSLRSQMAEGILRTLSGAAVDVASAGIAAIGVNLTAIDVMKEKGIDISKQYSKSFDEFKERRFDYVITVCGDAKEVCPVFPGEYKRIHWDIHDPGALALSGDAKLEAFRRTRDDLFARIERFLKEEIHENIKTRTRSGRERQNEKERT